MKLFSRESGAIRTSAPSNTKLPSGQHAKADQSFLNTVFSWREAKSERMYGLLEKQFRRTFAEASRTKGITVRLC